MDFALSPEHQTAQQLVRDFAQKEIAPLIKEYDRKQEPIPFALKRMGELGILGICFPVRYGGQGMDYLACEELEAVDTSLRVVMSVHTGLCAMNLFQWGRDSPPSSWICTARRDEWRPARQTRRACRLDRMDCLHRRESAGREPHRRGR